MERLKSWSQEDAYRLRKANGSLPPHRGDTRRVLNLCKGDGEFSVEYGRSGRDQRRPKRGAVMKDFLLARAGEFRERAATAKWNAEVATTDDLRQTYEGLAHGWTGLAESLEAAAWMPSEVLKLIK